MASIQNFLKKIQPKSSLFIKLLFIVLAFFLMGVSSSFYVNRMLRNHLEREAHDTLILTKLETETELAEPKTTLTVISKTIQQMILQGSSPEMVQEYMNTISIEAQQKMSGLNYDSIYGYFDVFGGRFLHCDSWEGDADYDPTNRPWYKMAVDAGGKITVTPMYYSLRSSNYVISYVHQIFDDSGRSLGVVCLDVPLGKIRETVANMRVTKGGYGILLGENMDIIAHPHQDLISKNIYEISPDFLMIANDLEFGEGPYGRILLDYFGEPSVAFSMRLDNGWIFLLLTPIAEYYQELRNLRLMISILGTILAGALIIILLGVDRAKNKADQQNQNKSILLANMEKQREIDERTHLMLNATPLCCTLWDKNLNAIDCNQEAVNLFELSSKQEFCDKFFELSPEFQPCGNLSKDKASDYIKKAFEDGYLKFEWMHQKLNKEPIPCEITMVRVEHENDYVVAGYIRDLREHIHMMKKIEQRDNLLNTLNKVALILLSAENEENMLDSILKGMELLGDSLELDRIQIWQNEMIDGTLYFTHKYEWLSELGRQKKLVPPALKFPYSSKPDWEVIFLKNEYINSPFSKLPEDDQKFLASWDIKSIVNIPLFLQDKFWGFFSLDDCKTERTFSDEEINILRSGGLLIANAFLHNGMVHNIRSTASQLKHALAEAQEANTAKSKFLAAMSHEIRTPMNVILGVTENQLMNDNTSKEIRESFESIFDSGNLLLHIINDILDLSKIEAGRYELSPVKYDVSSLINDTANMGVMRQGHEQVNFRLKVDENIPAFLFGDELRIKQILNNLLSNAFKYTDEGEIVLSFAIKKQEQSENRVVLAISVSDTGQGLTREQIDKLFVEYSRFNLEANRTTVGTGLGMSITRNLVNLMKGHLSVDSEPGKGTTFTVHIPQAVSGPNVLGKEAAEKLQHFQYTNTTRERNAKLVREPMPYGKVLVVDDMKSNINVAKLLLNPYGLKIDSVESGYEAIDVIKRGNVYDIIFMDHMMPKMDGIETVKQIRGFGYKNTIIALTANAIAGQLEIFLENGFDGFISKPIDIRQLNDSLNKHIRDKYAHKVIETSAKDDSPKTAVHIEIPELDTEKGLALYEGDHDIYIQVLRSYVPNALECVEKLRTVSLETLPDYAVNVHGLKSISAAIGAEKVRAEAFMQEMAAKVSDLDMVMLNNEALLADTENAALCIKTWLTRLDNQDRLEVL